MDDEWFLKVKEPRDIAKFWPDVVIEQSCASLICLSALSLGKTSNRTMAIETQGLELRAKGNQW
jgi:hypothetical protein